MIGDSKQQLSAIAVAVDGFCLILLLGKCFLKAATDAYTIVQTVAYGYTHLLLLMAFITGYLWIILSWFRKYCRYPR